MKEILLSQGSYYITNYTKSSRNLYFLSKNLINLSKNLKKSDNFVDEYLIANTFISVKSYSLINTDPIKTVKTTVGTKNRDKNYEKIFQDRKQSGTLGQHRLRSGKM